jgi:hypothetical protein
MLWSVYLGCTGTREKVEHVVSELRASADILAAAHATARRDLTVQLQSAREQATAVSGADFDCIFILAAAKPDKSVYKCFAHYCFIN